MNIGTIHVSEMYRVGITPQAVSNLKKIGYQVIVEKGAGRTAGFHDEMYETEGAQIKDKSGVLSEVDLLVTIIPPHEEDLLLLKKGATIISLFAPYQTPEVMDWLKRFSLNVISMDMIPRTTLAQSMDVLSSMASLAGYKAVLEATGYYQGMFPMMMTAAGTIPPSKVLVMGAGVAGLQAIATAKRLGAIVEAFDPRAAAKQDVLSLGATFVEVEGARDDTKAGGYAIQQSEDYLNKQRDLIHERAQKSDIIICTAQVRGKKAPILITEETVLHMKAGSIIVDLAASTGGNCALTKNNTTVIKNGVTIIGDSDLSDKLAKTASMLFANNVISFLKMHTEEGILNLDHEGDIMQSALIQKI